MREREIEEKIDKGREGWNTHGPSGTVLYFKPSCERIEGLEVNKSLYWPAASKVFSLCGQSPTVHTHSVDRLRKVVLPLGGALGHHSGPLYSLESGHPTCTMARRERSSSSSH